MPERARMELYERLAKSIKPDGFEKIKQQTVNHTDAELKALCEAAEDAAIGAGGLALNAFLRAAGGSSIVPIEWAAFELFQRRLTRPGETAAWKEE